jgi:cell division protease FtsH
MASNKNLNERPSGDRGNNGSPGGPGNKPGPNGEGPPPINKPSRGLLGLLAVIMLGVMSVYFLTNSVRTARDMTWKDFVTNYENKKIKEDSLHVTETGLVAELKTTDVPNASKTIEVVFNAPDRDFYLKELKDLTKGEFKVDKPTGLLTQVLISWLPLLLILGLIWFVLIRGLRNAGGGPGGMLGSFGKSRHKVLMREKTGVTFNDVAGIDEAKSEVEEIVLFLKNPKRFTKLGGRIPRGVLLVGDPGCGKTLLARAIAGEADVPFFSISGSDFVEMFVGVGASRVRDLFKQAKENSPCIIFLDEIDAVGRRRGGGFSSGGHDEREQTLNAILVEMDGFTTTDGIIVVAATNRADVLDPALTRPGRFDRQIVVPLPDVKGRLEILKVHAKNKKLSPAIDFERLARATPMFSGADLMSLMNEAAIAATLADKDFIEMDDLEEARDKVRYGRARKSRVREVEDTRLTAYHEAGHAVLNALLPEADPLHKVTIIPRGNFGGASFSLPEKDRHGYGMKYLYAHMRIACGGRIAEEKISGDISSGAMGDIASATGMARTMIEQWGMSPRLGFVRYAGEDTKQSFIPEKAYSDQTANIIDEEVKRLVDEAYADAVRLLTENWEKVVAVAEALIKYETLEANEVHKLMRGEILGKPTIRDLLAQEARKVPPALPPQAAKGSEPEIPPGAMPTPA